MTKGATAGGGEMLAYRGEEVVAERRWLGWLFVVTSVMAGVTPWVSFTHGISPVRAVREMTYELATGRGGPFGIGSGDWTILMMAMPFFAGVVIVYWKVRLAVSGRTRMWERVVVWVAGVGVAAIPTYLLGAVLIPDVLTSGRWIESEGYATVGSTAVLVAWAVLVWWLSWRGRKREVVATAVLYAGYLANAVICLTAFAEDSPDVGWWLTMVACGGLVGEMVLYLVGVGRGGRNSE